MTGTWAIIVAAGGGTRMGVAQSKTLVTLLGVPVIRRACESFRKVCEGIIVVIRPQEKSLFEDALRGLDVLFASGGETRRQSVENGLRILPDACQWVLIHDGARPLVSEELVTRVLEKTKSIGAAVPALRVFDTLKHVDESGRILKTVDRQGLCSVQTPQGFRQDALKEAYRLSGDATTDDAALMERAGFLVAITEGDSHNIKLTTVEDIILAEKLLAQRLPRIGFGFDVHRLVEGRRLILCGVDIPHEKGLLGHSDADVALHALMDALLGACAMGDLGRHFPDTSKEFEGASSLALLKRVKELLASQGFIPYNVDITIVAQQPKLAAHIPDMRQTVACTLGINLSCVSVKATTTERLGFEGRGEGISASVAVSIVTG